MRRRHAAIRTARRAPQKARSPDVSPIRVDVRAPAQPEPALAAAVRQGSQVMPCMKPVYAPTAPITKPVARLPVAQLNENGLMPPLL